VKQINSSMTGVGGQINKLTVVKSFKPAAAMTSAYSGKLSNLSIVAANAGISMRALNDVIRKNNLLFVKGVGIYDKATNQFMDIGKFTKFASVQAKRFKFEWLSVMFAGMALSRVFGGLVRTQLQLFGVTDMLSSAWTIVLLPIMEAITPILYTLLDIFMALPEDVKLLIGSLILLGAGLGMVFTVAGQAALAIMGFAMLGIPIGALIAIIAGLALIITGVVMVIKGKFEGIGLIIMGIGAILLLFIGWWALIPIAVGAAVYLIIKHWDKVKAFFGKVWDAIKWIFSKAWDFIKAIFWKASIVGIIIKNWDKIKNFFGIVWDKIKSIFKNAWDFIVSIPGKIFNAFKDLGKKIRDAITSIIPDWMMKLFKGGASIISKVGGFMGFQTGGIVPETGLALVHKGERVIPRSEVNRGAGSTNVFSPEINITATVSSDIDLNRLADEINRRLAPQFERAVGRGTI